jgi:predicted ribosome quality control (RQC) complex YloA/Tae2 family protein
MTIEEIIKKEPMLIYAPRIAFYTFSSLLKIDQHKAFEYGKKLLITPTYVDPDCDVIINNIKTYSDILSLSSEIYQLGAEAYQLKIDQIVYPELNDMPRLYKEMAEWFFRAKNKSKAIDALQNAIKNLKNKNELEIATFESELQKYKNM